MTLLLATSPVPHETSAVSHSTGVACAFRRILKVSRMSRLRCVRAKSVGMMRRIRSAVLAKRYGIKAESARTASRTSPDMQTAEADAGRKPFRSSRVQAGESTSVSTDAAAKTHAICASASRF